MKLIPHVKLPVLPDDDDDVNDELNNSILSEKGNKEFDSGDDCLDKSMNCQFNQQTDRELALLNALPKNIFQMPGSFSLWNDLVGEYINDELMKKLYSKIEKYSSAEKFAFAELIVKNGLDEALKMEPTVDDSIAIANYHPPLTKPRTFVEVAVQVEESYFH